MNDTNGSSTDTETDEGHVNGADTQESGKGRRKTRAEERIEAIDTSSSALMEQLAEWQARA